MKKYLAALFFLLLTGYLPPASAQLKIEVIPLQHRTADQVVPILRPLVGEGGTVTGMNDQLIIKSTPANLEELKKVLASLDKPLRRLMITVRQDIGGSTSGNQVSVDGHYTAGDVTLNKPGSGRGGGGPGISVTDESGNSVQLRAQSTHSSLADNNNFRVQAVEGQPAWIQTGKAVPVANQTTYATRGGVVVQDSVDYHDVTSGFYVIANLNGDRVTLSISPNMSREHPRRGGVFDVQNIETTVQGRLGEWISIGGVDQSSSREDESVLAGTRRSNQETRTVMLKVDEIQ